MLYMPIKYLRFRFWSILFSKLHSKSKRIYVLYMLKYYNKYMFLKDIKFELSSKILKDYIFFTTSKKCMIDIFFRF